MSRPEFHDKGLEITVTRSAGADGAVVVLIDTPNWEPDGSDGGPGLRVLVNDSSAYSPVIYVPPGDAERGAGRAELFCTLDEIDYLENR